MRRVQKKKNSEFLQSQPVQNKQEVEDTLRSAWRQQRTSKEEMSWQAEEPHRFSKRPKEDRNNIEALVATHAPDHPKDVCGCTGEEGSGYKHDLKSRLRKTHCSNNEKPAAATESVATLAAAAPAAAAPAAATWTFAYDENLQALLGRRFK